MKLVSVTDGWMAEPLRSSCSNVSQCSVISRTSVNRDITEATEGSAIGDGDAALIAYVNQPKALVLI
jgi:hypothetical protein